MNRTDQKQLKELQTALKGLLDVTNDFKANAKEVLDEYEKKENFTIQELRRDLNLE